MRTNTSSDEKKRKNRKNNYHIELGSFRVTYVQRLTKVPSRLDGNLEKTGAAKDSAEHELQVNQLINFKGLAPSHDSALSGEMKV